MLYAVSSSIWAWVLGRTIAFGPSNQICCWRPRLHSNTWYKLTPLRCLMPDLLVYAMPFILSLSQIPILLLSSVPTQILSAISLVSWHAFIPIFVIHIHQEWHIFSWCLANVTMALAATASAKDSLQTACTIVPTILFIWLTMIQSQLFVVNIVHHIPANTRQPRIV
jgi:hypothetical protein